MTPQYSFPPGCVLHYGMTAQTYTCMKCYLLHIHAVNYRLSNATNIGSRYRYLPVYRLVRHCFHCFHKWLIYLGHNSAWGFISCLWQKLVQATYRHLLNPPGDPPWCKSANYLNTKNRPFFNPSSWTVPVTWRSFERSSFYHFLSGGTNRLRNWFQHGCRNLLTIKQYQNKG